MPEPEANAAPPPPAENAKPSRWRTRGRPLIAGALLLLFGAVVGGKFTFASRWNEGWEAGLVFGALGAICLGVPHALVQYAMLAALERFTRLGTRSRSWWVNLPVLALVGWGLAGDLYRMQPKQVFQHFMQQPAPESLVVLDYSGRKRDPAEPGPVGIHFTASPADWNTITNGFAAWPVRWPTRPELVELNREKLKAMTGRSGLSLPLNPPLRVYRRDLPAGQHSGSGDFLFLSETNFEAFFFRGPIGDFLERME
jgi:hypothetical protein